jgi:hypothetical protein
MEALSKDPPRAQKHRFEMVAKNPMKKPKKVLR